MNERIRAREVRVIGDEGEQIWRDASLRGAQDGRERNLDLVEISPTAQLRFAASWTTGNSCTRTKSVSAKPRRKQKTITVKEVKFRINVDDHDYETKKNHVAALSSTKATR